MTPIKVVHVITSLSLGGAEQMLYRLLRNGDRQRFHALVICLTGPGPIGDQIENLGVTVCYLNLAPGKITPGAFLQLCRWLRAYDPDLIQTWLYHADLIGGLAAVMNRVLVLWNIHHSDVNSPDTKWTTRAVMRINALLSHRLPVRIVVCSRSAAQSHVQIGYDSRKMVYISNGVDTSAFKPDALARATVAAQLGIGVDVPLLGMAARFHPIKNQRGLLDALQLLHQQMPDVHLVLLGRDMDAANPDLNKWVCELGLEGSVHLLGERADMPLWMAALDGYVSSSNSEAFPTVLIEAMACATPCVTTAAGDSAEIVANTGFVVPIGDPVALAEACLKLLRLSPEARQALGAAARERVLAEYDLPGVVQRYQDLYRSVLSAG